MKPNENSTASLKDGMFSVTIDGRFNLDNRPITCPKCGADQGLTFTAFIYDQMARGKCPGGHFWDEPKINGHIVRDVYRRHAG